MQSKAIVVSKDNKVHVAPWGWIETSHDYAGFLSYFPLSNLDVSLIIMESPALQAFCGLMTNSWLTKDSIPHIGTVPPGSYYGEFKDQLEKELARIDELDPIMVMMNFQNIGMV